MVLILAVFYSGTPTRGIDFVVFFLFYSWTLARGITFGGNPNTWRDVGTGRVHSQLPAIHIKTVRDMEALKSFTEKEIGEDLHITKPGTAHD